MALSIGKSDIGGEIGDFTLEIMIGQKELGGCTRYGTSVLPMGKK